MASTTARRIATIALAAAICLTFMAVSLLLNPVAEGLAPAAELRCGETVSRPVLELNRNVTLPIRGEAGDTYKTE